MEKDIPEWVTTPPSQEEPPESVILDGSPNISTQTPEQIFVQGQYGGQGMMMPATNAVLALVLGILGLVMCSVCTAVPGLILAHGALATTRQYPGHPDHGLARAAQIISWVSIIVFLLVIAIYGSLAGIMLASSTT
tara:strand:+ start:136 stop:543 length:408 start_codon:yes stop_codon:yes gene_type:complete